MSVRDYEPRADGLDVFHIAEKFDSALTKDGIDIVDYILAFTELAKFFDLMGKLFETMGSDIRDQIKILEKLRNGADGSQYSTIQSILDFESADPATRLEPKRKDPSGSRTVLHLDRNLDFFLQFLKPVLEHADDDPLTPTAQTAYKATIGKYHGWLMAKAAGLAMHALPTKFKLFERVAKYRYGEALEGTKKMVDALQRMHERTFKMFEEKKLTDLPF